MRPRRGLLALGFVLMVINRVAALVLPYSTQFLIDTVISKHHIGQAAAAGLGGAGGDAGAGHHFFFAHAVFIESGAAPDHRVAPAGAGSYLSPAGCFLRRQQNWRVWFRAS